jgi:hypothetical protein
MSHRHPGYRRARLTTTAALTVALALGMHAAVAAAQTGDVVNGFGTSNIGLVDFTVEGSATGANPTGHYSLSAGPPGVSTWDATPRCMNVAGDRATLGFFIDRGANGTLDISGHAVLLWVQSWQGQGMVYSKLISPPAPGEPPPITCADPRPGPDPTFRAIGGFEGNISVDDRQPPIPPASDSVTGVADTGCILDFGQPPCSLRLILDVGAMSGPNGENPVGAVQVDELGPSPGGTTRVDAAVTCLSVSDRVAIIGVTGSRQRSGSGSPHTQIAGLIRVVDAGGPDSNADIFQFAIREGPRDGSTLLPGPTSCVGFPGPFPFPSLFINAPSPDFTNTAGNIVVTDTQALPTTKDQCKNGGWQSYGVFRNQGDCVSFVATKGKSPPANRP